MSLLLCFALLLLAAVLLSSLAHRTILSTAVLFLAAGFVLGDGMTGVISLTPDDPTVKLLAELALFAVLFTDGMKVGWPQLRTAWRLPGRALGWGMPLTLAVTALAAHFIVGLDWPESLLIGAVLAPTDPVFASALVGNEKVPPRLRHLLNVESGVNDGIALPFVMVFLAVSAGSDDLHLGALALELLVGLLIGVGVPWLALRLERLRFFAASTQYEPLNGLAIGMVVLALSYALHGNLFIAAFTAGITVATFGPRQRQAFEHFGELGAELLKLAALLVFGVLISPAFLGEISWTGWLFVAVAIFLARPVALWFSFLGAGLNLREQAAAMWFGPKGFASVVYGLIVLKSGIAEADLLFHLIAGAIVVSILLHSSTDVVVARWFDDSAETPAWHRRVRRLTGRR
ncbi:sodium/hydrogen exchanger family protein [Stackebrandtia albiflava]|uniref:Sodium/hydrogen exchanger family protein n=1 Tax=Stackebrandtia albiflava TaxID=406432 RepID=A0A562VE08_9ACTN|nr:cation:proton antiporter [Stackebrandtia albiflava]TWJ16051.1 sodium/hydrogen exchanger family protein [Stackebrandtia albiflava]